MTEFDLSTPFDRRSALKLGGGVAGGLLVSGAGSAAAREHPRPHAHAKHGSLPVKQIEQIIQAEGKVSNGVLDIGIDRDDAGAVTGPHGIPFSGAYEINGDLFFQPLGHHRAFFNGDLALRSDELNPVIDAILSHGLVFQAMHQHYFDLSPMFWFIHIRGVGHPLALARGLHNVLKATSTPLPQKPPSNPKTPLDAKRLARILHGDAQVGSDGVVTVQVLRRDRIVIDGIHVSPEANISTNVQFQPLSADGSQAAAGPDFSMKSDEVMPVTRVMRHQGWEDHCLYNQETGEAPQLYFSHMLKTGNPYALAKEIRRGLDRTASK